MSRVVVVTGASRGLGLEWVKQLSKDPNNLIIAVVRNPDKATALKPLLGPKVVPLKADITDIDTFPAVVKEIEKIGGGKVDLLINNAGVMVGAGADPSAGISTSTVAEWDQEWRVNVVGLVFFATALIPLVEKSSEKRIVNISSMLGDVGYHEKNPHLHFSSYSVTKAGVTMANLKFHHEFKDKGIIFLALNPGWVNTELAGEDAGQYAPLQPEESIRRCLSFVNRSTTEHSGKFWSLEGNPEAVAA